MRIGIVGCGAIGTKRASAAAGHDIALVADIDPARAERLAASTGATIAADWRALIEAPLDAVVVATRHDMLAAISLAAVEAGRHVLVEKPAGRSAAELVPVMAAAARRRRVVKVGFNHRFHPAIRQAQQMAAAGDIGPLMYVRGHYGHGGRPGYEREWRCQPELSGGGELLDQGSHLIDLARWLLGDLELAFAATPTFFWNVAVDDNCFLALRARGGQMAWLHASWTEWKNVFSFEVHGRAGKLAIAGLGGSYGTERLTFHRMLPGMGPPETVIWEYPFPDRSWDLEFAEFALAVAEQRQPLGSIADAHAVLSLIDRAYGRPTM